jgi:hypothetical protein
MFQSSSSPKAGCNTIDLFSISPHAWFQSSSSPKAGCNAVILIHLLLSDFVPILIQPESRMQYWMRRSANLDERCSNPHPARKPDAMADISNLLISTSSTTISAILLFLISVNRSIYQIKIAQTFTDNVIANLPGF